MSTCLCILSDWASLHCGCELFALLSFKNVKNVFRSFFIPDERDRGEGNLCL